MSVTPIFACKELRHRANKFLFRILPMDCQFKVEHEIVPAHKVVLAMASPVFENMFYGRTPEDDKPIPVTDISCAIFKQLIDYIYSRVLSFETIEMAYQMYYSATKYELPHLKDECVRYLEKSLRPTNAVRILEFALIFSERELINSCCTMISLNTKQVLYSEDFLKAHVKTVDKILSINSMDIENEYELFSALEIYAQKKCKECDSDLVIYRLNSKSDISADNADISTDKSSDLKTDNSNSDDEIDGGEKLEEEPEHGENYPFDVVQDEDPHIKNMNEKGIRKLVEKIRFLTMSTKQFAKGPGVSKLLTRNDKLALFHNISHPNTIIPVPEGFSKSTYPRTPYQSEAAEHVTTYSQCSSASISRDIYELFNRDRSGAEAENDDLHLY